MTFKTNRLICLRDYAGDYVRMQSIFFFTPISKEKEIKSFTVDF